MSRWKKDIGCLETSFSRLTNEIGIWELTICLVSASASSLFPPLQILLEQIYRAIRLFVLGNLRMVLLHLGMARRFRLLFYEIMIASFQAHIPYLRLWIRMSLIQNTLCFGLADRSLTATPDICLTEVLEKSLTGMSFAKWNFLFPLLISNAALWRRIRPSQNVSN